MNGLLLLFEGVSTDDVTEEFLGDLMDVAEDNDLLLTGISVWGDELEE